MNWNDLEKHFSAARVGRYHAAYKGDTAKATGAYAHNMLLAESMFPVLNVLEIALRNGVHSRLSAVHNRADWWELWRNDPKMSWQIREVDSAKSKLQRRQEGQTPDKIVAELTFGFWCSLFNATFQKTLWRDLRLVFPKCPKPQRQRHTISSALNQIRDLRNRVFHHEPLLWISPSLLDLHSIGTETVGWLDPQLVKWLANYDRLPASWGSWKAF